MSEVEYGWTVEAYYMKGELANASSRSASDQWLFINIIICIYTCTAKFSCILTLH